MALTWGLSAQPPHLSAEGKENITLSFPLRVVRSHREPQSCIILNCYDQTFQGAFPAGKQKCRDRWSACTCTLGCVWEMRWAEQLLPSTAPCVALPVPPWLGGSVEHKQHREHLPATATSDCCVAPGPTCCVVCNETECFMERREK